MADGDKPDGEERRAGDRRRYNRRRAEEVTPPYYEAFERMAVALEGIRSAMGSREIALPSDTGSTPPSPREPARRP
jgi:hypothetical protein